MGDKKWVNLIGCRNNGSNVMAKDYAKYTLYRKSRSKRSRLWTLLGLTVSLLLLAIVPFLFTYRSASPTAIQAEKKHLKPLVRPKTALLEPPKPLSPEPKFDFYNVLPDEQPTLSDSTPTRAGGNLVVPEIKDVLPNKKVKQNSVPLLISPEQLAIAEAKKQLEHEVSQFDAKAAGYVLILGEYPEAQQAEQSQAQALLKGFPVKSIHYQQQGKEIYQLFVGPYPDLVSVTEQKKRLIKAGISIQVAKQIA
jgi:SPOR domain